MKNIRSSARNSRRSRGRRRRFVAFVCALLLALVVAVVLFERRSPPSQRAIPLPRSTERPVGIAPRPLPPAAPWTSAQQSRLRAALDDAFAPAIADADGWSLVVLSADGRPLYDNRGDAAVTPASTQKLIVAATSLADLGSNFHYHTELLARDGIGSDGVLRGDLWLGGSGDPSLRYRDLGDGVAHLVDAGLKQITGAVAVDGSVVAPPEMNPLWDPDDVNEDFDAPVSGISLDEDTVEFHVIGGMPGEPATVSFLPRSAAVRFSGQVTTSEGSDDVIVAAAQTPNEFLVSGSIPPGVEEKFYVPVHGIARYAGAVTAAMLTAAGVSAEEPPIVAPAPLDAAVLWDHPSRPLGELVARMLYVSDNHYAEQLLRTLGALRAGRGDVSSGLAVERAFLRRRGIPTPELHLVDGSGLARANRIAAMTLAKVLLAAQTGDPDAALYERLPQGGRQGTLKEYDFTTALGRVRAKSGHLTGVGALAGYVNTYHHGRIVFAFLIDGSPGDPDSAIVRAVDRLATL